MGLTRHGVKHAAKPTTIMGEWEENPKSQLDNCAEIVQKGGQPNMTLFRCPHTYDMPRHARTLLMLAPIAAAAAYAMALATMGGRVWMGRALAAAAAMNVATLLGYGLDKWRAIRGGRRVSEAVLLGLAALGGSPGALVAQRLFRHKTAKRSFQVAFWILVILQAAIVIAVRIRGQASPW